MRAILVLFVVALVACSADPSGMSDAGSCPFADAPGVIRVNTWPDPCVYVCDENHSMRWCDVVNVCVDLSQNGNCGACGVTCMTGQVCRTSIGYGYRCLAPR